MPRSLPNEADELRQDLLNAAWEWTDHKVGAAPGDALFRSDGTFVLPSCGPGFHGKWYMTDTNMFCLYWVQHPSAPTGARSAVPFTRQGDGSWHMPQGSKVTLRKRGGVRARAAGAESGAGISNQPPRQGPEPPR